jgi:precorrin-2 dehydrogenase/sirohydrochlorin ferrochelatase
VSREAASWYPLFLNLHGLSVKVIGGGAVAARKVRGLADAGARVTVIAPRFCASLARRRGIVRLKRAFRTGDLKGARLLFLATDDPMLNRTIAAEAERRGLWANVASPPDAGRISLPASFRRGSLCVAVSTGGASAAAASALRKDLSEHLDAAWSTFLKLLKVRRHKVQRSIADPEYRRRLLLALGDPIWVTLIRSKGATVAARRMDELIAHTEGGGSGKRAGAGAR